MPGNLNPAVQLPSNSSMQQFSTPPRSAGLSGHLSNHVIIKAKAKSSRLGIQAGSEENNTKTVDVDQTKVVGALNLLQTGKKLFPTAAALKRSTAPR